jgi:hypothetical protein
MIHSLILEIVVGVVVLIAFTFGLLVVFRRSAPARPLDAVGGETRNGDERSGSPRRDDPERRDLLDRTEELGRHCQEQLDRLEYLGRRCQRQLDRLEHLGMEVQEQLDRSGRESQDQGGQGPQG